MILNKLTNSQTKVPSPQSKIKQEVRYNKIINEIFYLNSKPNIPTNLHI